MSQKPTDESRLPAQSVWVDRPVRRHPQSTLPERDPRGWGFWEDQGTAVLPKFVLPPKTEVKKR